ncbi:hypothetical protein [Aliivibrio fischeri]|uniref:hypothetical protein n=1 Tax=Aliivibrio fischeri TaxID=668 RepID=UPI00114D074D|nr:hypothetical protein [Aliivibrio fischeri]
MEKRNINLFGTIKGSKFKLDNSNESMGLFIPSRKFVGDLLLLPNSTREMITTCHQIFSFKPSLSSPNTVTNFNSKTVKVKTATGIINFFISSLLSLPFISFKDKKSFIYLFRNVSTLKGHSGWIKILMIGLKDIEEFRSLFIFLEERCERESTAYREAEGKELEEEKLSSYIEFVLPFFHKSIQSEFKSEMDKSLNGYMNEKEWNDVVIRMQLDFYLYATAYIDAEITKMWKLGHDNNDELLYERGFIVNIFLSQKDGNDSFMDAYFRFLTMIAGTNLNGLAKSVPLPKARIEDEIDDESTQHEKKRLKLKDWRKKGAKPNHDEFEEFIIHLFGENLEAFHLHIISYLCFLLDKLDIYFNKDKRIDFAIAYLSYWREVKGKVG